MVCVLCLCPPGVSMGHELHCKCQWQNLYFLTFSLVVSSSLPFRRQTWGILMVWTTWTTCTLPSSSTSAKWLCLCFSFHCPLQSGCVDGILEVVGGGVVRGGWRTWMIFLGVSVYSVGGRNATSLHLSYWESCEPGSLERGKGLPCCMSFWSSP